MGPKADLSFDGYVLDHVELHECNYNWKTFIEVYLEDYHVGPFHPGLGSFVTCDDLRWEFGKNYSVQTVGVANRLGKAAAPCTNAGMKPCWRTVTACRQSMEPSGSRCTRTSWWSGIRTCSRSRRCTHQPDQDAEHGGSSTTPKKSQPSSANSWRRKGRLHGNPHRRRRDRRTHGRGPQGLCWNAATTKSAPTRAPWKTACSTFTSGTARPWGARCLNAEATRPHQSAAKANRSNTAVNHRQ